MLVAENLTVSYGDTRIVHNVSLEVGDGEVVCLMGRNGVGKTTLLKALMGILPPGAGRVLWDGRDITRWPPYERARAGIGYVPQGRGIFPQLTAYENLLVGLEGAPRPAKEALDEVLAAFPALRRVLLRLGGNLSGGEQQQLAIARALMSRPRLLLLDEPTEGIQPSTVQEIGDFLRRLKAGGHCAVLLVEQFLDFALRLGDRYAVMEKGAIVASGPMSKLGDEVVQRYLAV